MFSFWVTSIFFFMRRIFGSPKLFSKKFVAIDKFMDFLYKNMP